MAAGSSAKEPGERAGRPTGPVAAEFRPDLEGLRGVAILLVLAFHAGGPVPGGFVGVDVFFVLSGFLITGLLLREVELSGRVDFGRFYARRARRILPAALVVIAGTLLASAVVLAPLDLPRIGGDAAAAALSIGNIRFAFDATDYFGATLPSPLLHYWSLGVEEQFYVLWPGLLALAAAVAGARRGPRLAMAAVLVGSLAAAMVLTSVSAPWAFYSLPTRAWQLALGGVLAATLAWQRRPPDWVRAGLGWAGLGLIIAAALGIDASVPYPGTAALIPTLGAGAVLLAAEARFAPRATLALPPLRWLGRISFPLYLVHWPVFVLPAAPLPLEAELPAATRVGLVGLAVALAAAVHVAVERPIHRGAWAVALPPRRVLGAAGAGVALVAVGSLAAGGLALSVLPGGPGPIGRLPDPSPTAGATIAASPTFTPAASEGSPGPSPAPTVGLAPTPQPPPATPPPLALGRIALTADVRPALANVRADVERIQGDGCNLLYAGAEPPDCVYGAAEGPITLALVGDSHAAQWFPALERIAGDRGWRLVPFTKVSCRFVDLPILSRELGRAYTECEAWRERVVERLVELQPDIVVVASARGMAVLDPADDDPTRQGEAMARLLAPVPGQIVVLADTPQSIYDVPACLSRNLEDVRVCETPIDEAFNWRRLRLERAAVEALDGTLIDMTPWICPADRCPVVFDDRIVYRDVHHLTATFAASLADPLGRLLPPAD